MDDPATGKPIGPTGDNLKAAIASETHEYTDMYPGMARVARREGFDEIADWFETLAKAGKSHAGRFQKALERFDLNASTTIEETGTRSEGNMDAKTDEKAGKCPVVHGTTNVGMRSNSDWWPNQLNLRILRQNSPQSDPTGKASTTPKSSRSSTSKR